MKKCIKEYLFNSNQLNYNNVEVFYSTYINPIEPLNHWYMKYLERNNLKIIPPQDEIKRISLFDYKSNDYKITKPISVDY